MDHINVFPVADSDTGRNLKMSLAPLHQFNGDQKGYINKLLMTATGNSGNIAARFFSGFLTVNTVFDLAIAAKIGRDYAWESVSDPKHGTMLTFFDEVSGSLERDPLIKNNASLQRLIEHWKQAVLATHQTLPILQQAGVVDAGALGMFLYLEGFFKWLFDQMDTFQPVTEMFQGKLRIASYFQSDQLQNGAEYCVDTLVRLHDPMQGLNGSNLSGNSQSIIVASNQSYMKIHLHTNDLPAVQTELESIGNIVRWSDEQIATQPNGFQSASKHQTVHVMSDAAGSIAREVACKLGITLLDSYIITEDISLPETLVDPPALYKGMRDGMEVSTAQASTFQRYQCYQSILEQYAYVLYLCVGSAYTGNFQTATDWKKENDPENRLILLDTQAASGKLGVIMIATARYAQKCESRSAVVAFARQAIAMVEEYIFIDQLKYLVKGGRLSKTSGFLGDFLSMKPVVSPMKDGVRKVGTLRRKEDQAVFALERLKKGCLHGSKPFILLQYTDNRKWVEDTVQTILCDAYPQATLLLQSLSVTSGVHTGPGTWSMAFLPESGNTAPGH